jgi:hypothetical protein
MAIASPSEHEHEHVTAPVKSWLLKGHPREIPGPHTRKHRAETYPWWKVVCLTGVDYFSSLGYQPGIAALAAGVLSPIATLILVIITLFGALPMYKRVAERSPNGDGSISMLEKLLPWWQGKVFVLCLIGFVVTGFVITITLSAADATAHIVENPLTDFLRGQEVIVTLVLVSLLGAVFLKGFGEAITTAVALVGLYLLLNIVVIVVGFAQLIQDPGLLSNWSHDLTNSYSNPFLIFGTALVLFPALALGLSGFETGVLVMPLVAGSSADTPAKPMGRIRNSKKLLTTAATIMSVLLLSTSLITITLIPSEAFEKGGEANGRALSYLAHQYVGNAFGTAYDISTVLILWFAGASAMAGLLNIVPRYLPRYGMAPDWALATRPLVLIFTLICMAVTVLFQADVDAQAGAYATGVLVVITSATIAVTLSARRHREGKATFYFGLVAAIFVYTTIITVVQRPEGLQIALIFIAAIIVLSLVSRVSRSTELRVQKVVLNKTAERLIDEATRNGSELRIIANHPDERTPREYLLKEREEREASHIPTCDPVLFLEVTVSDASEFTQTVRVRGVRIGDYHVLRADGAAVPNVIAAVLLYLRDRTGKKPHVYFGWTEGNPLKYLARFVLFGEGDIAPLTHEILRQAEPNPKLRPAIHIG